MLTPETSYWALLIVQALHLSHHRLAKRHINREVSLNDLPPPVPVLGSCQ